MQRKFVRTPDNEGRRRINPRPRRARHQARPRTPPRRGRSPSSRAGRGPGSPDHPITRLTRRGHWFKPKASEEPAVGGQEARGLGGRAGPGRGAGEPHPDDFVEDGITAVGMIRGINSPNVSFLYCPPHTFHMGGNMTQIMEYAGDLITHVHIADSFDHTASSGLRYIVNPPARPHAFISIWISSRARSTGTTSSPAWPGSGSTARHRVRIRLGRPRDESCLAKRKSWSGTWPSTSEGAQEPTAWRART